MDKKELLKRLVADMKAKEAQVEEDEKVPMLPSKKGLTERVDIDKASKIANVFGGGGDEEEVEEEEVADESEDTNYLKTLFPFFFPDEEPTPVPTPTPTPSTEPKKKCKDNKLNC